MKTLIRVIAVLAVLATVVPAVAKRAITFEDLMKIQRISDPQVSRDGKWIAYVLTTVDLAADKKTSHIWLLSTEGGRPRQVTRSDGSDSSPRWGPHGGELAFLSTRGGKSQVWILPLGGGEAFPLTSISTEVDSVQWATASETLAFTSKVYPDCGDDACNQKRLEEAAAGKVKAHIIDELLFRHWNEYRAGKYTHLFSISMEARQPRDLTPGRFDSPTWFLGGPDGYAISPDGTEICYTSNRTGRAAWSTNNDLFLVAAGGGEAKNITIDNPGSDASPQYSPNGRYIAYTSQARDGYESDLFRLRVYDRQTGKVKYVTPEFDQWVDTFRWAPDSDTIYFTAPERGQQPIFKTSLSKARVEKVVEGSNADLQITPDGKSLIFTRSSITRPSEVYQVSVNGSGLTQLTHANDALLADLDMNPAEPITSKGALGADIHSLVVKPPGFDPNQKYPGLLLIHGGPQSQWEDAWSYRWNAQMFTARGYVVMMPNPHGSTGYGQKFVEEISGDWGGACYEDLMAAADTLESLPYVAKGRIGAAGASFGGFMVNWIAGHTTRFKALMSHDGVYDQRSMYGETEELWFPEWEFNGVPWENPKLYEKWSPSNFVQKIQTPMLLVEGALDYRVPEGQAFQLFTALQRRGVPSKLLYYPDEGHWVLKPQNSQLWYRTVLDWLDQYLKP
jgi:dipeptidyl aminopeptidase/acylaminoacyl peptidase